MKFHKTDLADAVLIEPTPFEDHRGSFARTFCVGEFRNAGLETTYVQQNASFNHAAGTLRGMHFQLADHAEVKVVRCIAGAIFDVIVDLRPQSPSYLAWQGFELSEANGLQLYVPRGFAHGFVTLRELTSVAYLVSTDYAPGAEGGLRWNDPLIAIAWPVEIVVLSDKDAQWPDYRPES
jgi:dTDP-4-dehydrorhamnose 3,5-epimerase